jgi:hypothetical protein
MLRRGIGGAAAVVFLAGAAVGCMPSTTELDTGPLTSSFAVSDYFTPGGFIGDATSPGSLGIQVNQGCKPRPAGARGNCYVFTYKMKQGATDPFAGMFWLFPGNNWGTSPGRAVDTTKFQQIRFSAAVEAPAPAQVNGNNVFFTTQAGGIDATMLGDPTLAHADAFSLNQVAQIGTGVGPDLQAFHMPINDSARTNNCANPDTLCVNGAAGALIGAFGWVLPYPKDGDATGTTPVKVYIDDIVWDTEPPPSI